MDYRDPFDVAQQCLSDPVFRRQAGPLYACAFSGDPVFRESPAAEFYEVDDGAAYAITYSGASAEFDPSYACGLVPVEMKKKEFKGCLQAFVKRVKERVKEQGGDAKAFMASAEKFAARVLGMYKDVEIFSGLSADTAATLTIRHYPEGSVTGQYLVWKHGCIKEEPVGTSAEMVPDGPTVERGLYCFSYNHLLCGKEHKKEAEIVDEAKACGLTGLIVYGTPGVILLQCGPEEAVEYLKACSKAGKKAQKTWSKEMLVAQEVFDAEGFSPIGTAMETIGSALDNRGLTTATLDHVKQAMEALGHGDSYRQAIGVA
jgi:hypothetical protein